jgi:hypothetical protein
MAEGLGMAKKAKTRRPNAVLGFIKAAWVMLVMLVLLPVWLIRGAVTRARFRAELRAAGVPLDAARRLSNRLKVGVRDISSIRYPLKQP